jgi:hypothetical protein
MLDIPQAAAEPTTEALLTELMDEIEALQRLPVNWDGEDALPVSEEVASRAKELLRPLAGQAHDRGLVWRRPSVAPAQDGGLDLSWEVDGRWALLMLHPGEPGIECVTQTSGAPPRRRLESAGDALQAALWALSG